MWQSRRRLYFRAATGGARRYVPSLEAGLGATCVPIKFWSWLGVPLGETSSRSCQDEAEDIPSMAAREQPACRYLTDRGTVLVRSLGLACKGYGKSSTIKTRRESCPQWWARAQGFSATTDEG